MDWALREDAVTEEELGQKPDGVYSATLRDGLTYQVTKRRQNWYLTDGTGWREKLDQRAIVILKANE